MRISTLLLLPLVALACRSSQHPSQASEKDLHSGDWPTVALRLPVTLKQEESGSGGGLVAHEPYKNDKAPPSSAPPSSAPDEHRDKEDPRSRSSAQQTPLVEGSLAEASNSCPPEGEFGAVDSESLDEASSMCAIWESCCSERCGSTFKRISAVDCHDLPADDEHSPGFEEIECWSPQSTLQPTVESPSHACACIC